jgi:hypothetical protein
MKTRRAPNPLRIDPTRTSLLRRRYAAEVKRRFARLRVEVIRAVLHDDGFGLQSTRFSVNAFCATGKGGGVDPSCSPGKGSGSASTASKGQGGANATAAGHEGLTARLRKLGAKAAFATWTAGQALAERVAKQRGHSDEQARRLRGVLSAMDVAAFKPLSIALGSSGIGATAVGALSLIPPATAAYLAYSTARNPMATYRAARDLVGEALGSVTGRARRLVGNAAIDNAGLIADALESHQWSDWYIALFHAALNQTRDVQKALDVADAVFKEHPTDPAADELTANVDCGTGAGGFKPGNTCAKGSGRFAFAEAAGVEVDEKGYATLRKFFGVKGAANIPAMYLNSTGKIHINEKSDYWKDPAAAAKKQHESGWMSTGHPNHVIHHETGHALQDKAGNLSRMTNEQFSATHRQALEGKVSRYAMTQPKEFIAEVFAGLAAGKTYDEAVMRYYRGWNGPAVPSGLAANANHSFRREMCERCGGTGQQEAGRYDWNTGRYDRPAGVCDLCHGDGYLGIVGRYSLSDDSVVTANALWSFLPAADKVQARGLPRSWGGRSDGSSRTG